MTYSSCLHDQQDLCWGNTSKDTSEEPQEAQKCTIPALFINMSMSSLIWYGMVKNTKS